MFRKYILCAHIKRRFLAQIGYYLNFDYGAALMEGYANINKYLADVTLIYIDNNVIGFIKKYQNNNKVQ